LSRFLNGKEGEGEGEGEERQRDQWEKTAPKQTSGYGLNLFKKLAANKIIIT